MKLDYLKILTGGLPLAVGNVSVVMMPLIDTAMLSRYGHNEMITGGLYAHIYTVIFILGESIILGFSPLYGRFFENRNSRLANITKALTFRLVLIYGLLSLIIFSPLPILFPANLKLDNLPSSGHLYMLLLLISITPNLIFIHLWESLSFLQKNSLIAQAAALQLTLNTLLNFFLINGTAFIPALGLTGAGAGTLISSIAAAVYLYQHHKNICPKPKQPYRRPGKNVILILVRRILTVGTTSSLAYSALCCF